MLRSRDYGLTSVEVFCGFFVKLQGYSFEVSYNVQSVSFKDKLQHSFRSDADMIVTDVFRIITVNV